MRPCSPFVIKMLVFPLLASLLYTTSSAQLKHKHLVDEKKALSRKSEDNIVLVNTRTINDLTNKCMELGIENIKLVFTRIRSSDVKDYVMNHPEAAGYEKEIIGRLTVLIKVEGPNITEPDFVTDNTNQANSITEKMSRAGLKRLIKPYGGLQPANNILYFEVGSICPPPNSCN